MEKQEQQLWQSQRVWRLHASIIKLVHNYQSDLEEFGLVRFKILPRVVGQHGGGGHTEIAQLNEQTIYLQF